MESAASSFHLVEAPCSSRVVLIRFCWGLPCTFYYVPAGRHARPDFPFFTLVTPGYLFLLTGTVVSSGAELPWIHTVSFVASFPRPAQTACTIILIRTFLWFSTLSLNSGPKYSAWCLGVPGTADPSQNLMQDWLWLTVGLTHLTRLNAMLYFVDSSWIASKSCSWYASGSKKSS